MQTKMIGGFSYKKTYFFLKNSKHKQRVEENQCFRSECNLK